MLFKIICPVRSTTLRVTSEKSATKFKLKTPCFLGFGNSLILEIFFLMTISDAVLELTTPEMQHIEQMLMRYKKSRHYLLREMA